MAVPRRDKQARRVVARELDRRDGLGGVLGEFELACGGELPLLLGSAVRGNGFFSGARQ